MPMDLDPQSPPADTPAIVWRVRLYWIGPNDCTWESACDGSFPAGTTAMQAIEGVAKWRGVDLAACTQIKAERGYDRTGPGR